MSNLKISFIGGGNMAEAILSNALKSGTIEAGDITVCDISDNRLEYLRGKYSVVTVNNTKDSLDKSDFLVFAVKPQHFEDAVKGLDRANFAEKAVVSIMAGVTIERLKKTLGAACRIARVMPNTPALVSEGMSMLCSEHDLKEDEAALVKNLLKGMGQYEVLSEKYMDAFIGIAGSSPAYVYMFIEAMADGGVLNGLPRNIAYKLAAQSVMGSAKMVLESGFHPAVLKDMVCSPGGTTIEAVESLENDGFRGTVINAVNACTEKSKYLSRNKDEEN